LRLCGEEANGRFEESFQENVQVGNFQLIFTHPEVVVKNKHCRDIRDVSVKLLSQKCCGSGSRCGALHHRMVMFANL